MKKTSVVLIVMILFFGFLLRISGIKFGLPSKNLTLTTYNPDEPLSFYPMEKWNPRKLYFHPQRALLWGGFHLYVLAGLIKTAQIFGIVKLDSREFLINNLKEVDKLYIIGRLLMIISGVLSVLLTYLICKSYNETTGLIAGFIFAILPAHIVNSFYVRPDVLMIFFALLAVWFSLKIMETDETKFYILCCFFVGLSTATKLSGAVYGIFPLVAHFLKKRNLREKLSDMRFYLIPFMCLTGFIIGCPYSVIDFNSSSESFWHYLKLNFSLSKGTMNPGQEILFGTGWKSYFRYYLPYAIGIPLMITGIIGFIFTIYNIFTKKYETKKFDVLFTISGIIIFSVISSTKNQAVWYTLPVLPFFVIFSARLFEKSSPIPLKKFTCLWQGGWGELLKWTTLFTVLSYTLIYSLANLTLYTTKNVREEASEWIEKNIPKGSKIAIAKSYFWTPAILRQYAPPYQLLIGADSPNLGYSDGIIGLKKYLEETEYIVLSEFEFREFVHPKIKKYFPEHAEVLEKIMNTKIFEKVAEFDKQAKFFLFKFKKNYPPGDWLIPNPKIVIYKKLY
ncbi:MAG: ArnT family glycosyltransferase [Endomicrobiia bacterium]